MLQVSLKKEKLGSKTGKMHQKWKIGKYTAMEKIKCKK